MPAPSPGRLSLHCESLESRDTPASPLVSESFDAISTPWLPSNWTWWANNGQEYYAVGRTAGLSGKQSMAVYGTVGVTSYVWNSTAIPADATVAAAVKDGTPAPVGVIARGSGLGTAKASYVEAVLTPSGAIELHQVTNGTDQLVAQLSPKGTAPTGWTRLTLTVQGITATLQVQRTDTGYYLAADGTWQSGPTIAIRSNAMTEPPSGTTTYAGVGRLPGPYGTAYVDDFTVTAAPQVVPPTIPSHYDNIRIAELAYNGTPVGTTETSLLQNSVDLVVSNPAYLSTFNQASPDTPQLIYTNYTNLYQGLLTDWLAYARQTGADPESAFYHVTQATPFQGDSASSQPVSWFWGVQSGSAVPGAQLTDLTAAAHGSGTTGVPFGGTGTAITIGYPEPYREVNVTLSKAAAAGWTGALEYATLDSRGNLVWKPLTTITNTTAGLKTNGQVTFDPPADWAAVTLKGTGSALYYIRVRTTTGTVSQAPVAKTILGRDYVGANGTTSGVIPAFDYSADTNHDGYLSDAEYAKRKPGDDARFAYESRLFYPNYGQMRFATNVAAPDFQAWAVDYSARLLKSQPGATGLFVDNSNGKLAVNPAGVKESLDTYAQSYADLLGAINRKIAPGGGWVIANTGGGGPGVEDIAREGVSSLDEFGLRPLTANHVQFDDLVANLAYSRQLSGGKAYEILDSLPQGLDATDPRTELATLAMYYAVADPNLSFLMVNGGNEPATSWTRHWIPAATYDVGKPTGTVHVAATGADPANPTLVYKVYERDYQNAKVFYKPLSYTRGVSGTLADNTATTISLGGLYRPLNADGTLGAATTRLTLRNGEGAIMVRVK